MTTESKAVLGARLRAEREAQGWSRVTLAGRLRGAAGATTAAALPDAESLSHMVKEWEAGKHAPSARYQYLYELALDRPAGYLFPGSARAAARNSAAEVAGSFTAAWTMENAVLALSGTLGAYMDRRQFVVITGSALADLAPGWTRPWTLVPAGKLASAASGGRVDAEVAGALERRMTELWRLDDLIGGAEVGRLTDADLDLTLTLLRDGAYDAAIERRLLTVAGGLCRSAGWACLDAAQHTAAGRYWHAGLRLFHGAGDKYGAVSIMAKMAQQMNLAHTGRSAITVLDGARSLLGPRASGTVHSHLDAYQVHAHAAIGEPADAVRMLGRADSHWDSRDPKDAPDWAYWIRRPSETTMANIALIDAGRPEIAAANMNAWTAREDCDSPRDRVVALAVTADAELAQGHLEPALAAAGSAVDGLGLVSSGMTTRLLTGFARRLPAHEPAARNFRERLRELPKAS